MPMVINIGRSLLGITVAGTGTIRWLRRRTKTTSVITPNALKAPAGPVSFQHTAMIRCTYFVKSKPSSSGSVALGVSSAEERLKEAMTGTVGAAVLVEIDP